MSSARRPWLGAVLALGGLAAATTTATPRANAADAPPPAVTIVDPTGGVTLDDAGTARLVVRNDSDRTGRPTAKVLGARGLTVRADVTAAELAPGAAGAVTLRFSQRAAADLKGQLVVGLADVAGVRQAVTPIAAKAQDKPAVSAQPAAVAIDLVRHCPFTGGWLRRAVCGGDDRSPVWVAPETAPATTARALGSGAAGQTATAELRPRDGAPAPPKGLTAAEVRAQATAHGDYEPVLTLDPGADKPTQITVSVRAREWVGLALLAVVLGALVGGLTNAFYEARRTRALLLLRLQVLAEDFTAALRTADPAMPPPEPVFEALTPPREADGGQWADLLGRVRACTSDAQAQALEPKVAAAEDVLARWRAIDRALGALRKAYTSRGYLMRESGDPLMSAVRATLKGATVPAKEEDVVAQAAALRATAALLPLVERVYERRGREATLALIYAHVPEGSSLTVLTPGAAKAFEADLRAALLVARPPTRLRLLTAGLLGPSASSLPPAWTLRMEDAASVSAVRPASWLRARIQLYDWLVFAVTSVIASGVYVVTVYDGRPWGSVGDYVTAFGAGFGGSALIGVAVFPLVRATIGRAVRAA
jgi:hypothetical protein